jgi:hypothetical protein
MELVVIKARNIRFVGVDGVEEEKLHSKHLK